MAGGSPMSIVNHLSSGGSNAISTVGLPKPLSANHVAASIRSLLLAFWSRRTAKTTSTSSLPSAVLTLICSRKPRGRPPGLPLCPCCENYALRHLIQSKECPNRNNLGCLRGGLPIISTLVTAKTPRTISTDGTVNCLQSQMQTILRNRHKHGLCQVVMLEHITRWA